MWVFRVLEGFRGIRGFWGVDPGFVHFGGVGLFWDVVRIVHPTLKKNQTKTDKEIYPQYHPIILSPIRGGRYRGIYDIGFKRGFYGVYRPFIE
jgi:hypothetical protein